MDSTGIPVYGQQGNRAYNSHCGSTCSHPLLLLDRDLATRGGRVYICNRAKTENENSDAMISGPKNTREWPDLGPPKAVKTIKTHIWR